MSKRTRLALVASVAGLACSSVFADEPKPLDRPIHSLRVGGRVHAGHTDTMVQDIYNNGVDPNITDGYFGSGNTDVVDDIYFNVGPGSGPGPGTTGSGQLLSHATIGLATLASTDPNAQVDMSLTWFNGFNPAAAAGVAVGTSPSTPVVVTVQAPAGGWQANTVYFVDVDLSTLPGGGIQTTNEFGGARLALFETGTTTPSSQFEVAWYGNGVKLGYNSNTWWFDNNGDGIVAGDEGFVFTSATATQPKGALALELQANVDSGSCCLPNGSCLLANSASCTRGGGVFGGNGSTCGTCVQPGACITTGGSCILANSSQCVSISGTFKGAGSNCATSVCRSGTGTIVLWDNGPLGTGTLIGATSAPAGSQWSEVAGMTGCSNNTAGYSGGTNGPFRLSDDFVVPQGETWSVTSIDTYAYQTGAVATGASPISAVNLQIWNGPPYDPSSTVVAGDAFTNVLTSSTFASLYRAFWNTPGTTRPVWQDRVTFAQPVVLAAGHYWVDWQTSAANAGAHFAPTITTRGLRGTAGRNALQQVPYTTPTWVRIEEQGAPVDCGAGVFGGDFPFVIRGSSNGHVGCGSGCYANCDLSTTVPFLNVNDFICFQQKFAGGDSYANCDLSTTPPILNVNDFICFQSKFASGCSAP